MTRDRTGLRQQLGAAASVAEPRRGSRRLLELAALSGFVVAQPVFQTISSASEFLVFRKAAPLDVVLLTLAFVAVPPVVLWSVEWVAGRFSPRLQAILHLGFVATLAGLFAAQVVAPVPRDRGLAVMVAAVVAPGAFVAAYLSWRPARVWLRVASPAPIVFAVLFLFASPVSALLDTGRAPTARGVPTGELNPVVMLVFDELPLLTLLDEHGNVDERLFPNFAALARDGTFFRNATGVAAFTPHAVPAMLTGRLPRGGWAPVTSRYPDNLFTLLDATHDVRAFETLTTLCPPQICPPTELEKRPLHDLVGDSARLWWAKISPGSGGEDAAARWLRETTVPAVTPAGEENEWFLVEGAVAADHPLRFREFLGSIDGKGTPFHFLHLLLPHAPWRFLPDGSRYPPRALGLAEHEDRTDEKWPALVERQRHILQTVYVDRLVGQTMARLRKVGLYDRSAIVVTADHGISFTAGIDKGVRQLREGNGYEVAWVPLFMKAPGHTPPEVRDDNVMIIDLAPTVAELAGTTVPWDTDGISLVTERRASREKVWVNDPAGERFALGGEEGRRTVLDRARERLGRPERGVEGLFELGPFADLVGTVVPPGLTEAAGVATVDDAGAFDTVDKRGGEMPSLVTGHLDATAARSGVRHVAIAVNGTIAAVSELYSEGEESHRFAAMVSPARMRDGANLLEVLLVDAAPEDPRLLRLTVAR